MPDKDPLLLSTYTGLNYKDTLVNVKGAIGDSPELSATSIDPIGDRIRAKGNKTPTEILVPKTSLADVAGELNPRFDMVRYGYNNEDAYAQQQSTLDKAFNGIAKGVGLAATTFVGGIADVVYGIPSAIANGDLTKVWNNDVTKALQAFNTRVDNEYLPNYYSDQENKAAWYSPDNLFTANFLFDKLVKNAGFAVGAIYSGNLVGKGLGIAGKGLGSVFSNVAEYSAASKSFSKINQNLARLFSQGKNVEAAELLKRNISTLPELESVNAEMLKISQQFNAINNVQDVTNRTIRALYASAGESGFEAIGTATAFKDNLIQQYKDKWGTEVPEEEMKRIEGLSEQVGNASFLANMAVLSATEYLQLPHLLGSSYRTSKAAANVFKNTEEVVFDKATNAYIRPSVSKFGRAKKFISTYVFDPKESAQEFLQTSTDVGVQSYYNKAYQGEETNAWIEGFEAIKSSLATKEGGESALLGGITGGVMQARNKYKTNTAKATNTASLISELPNSTFKQAFQDKVNSSQRHITIEKENEAHLANGDKLSWLDGKFDQTHNYISTRVKYGRGDLISQDLEERINLASTDKGFAELQALGEVPENMGRQDYLSKLNEFKQQVANTISIYEAANLMYGGKVNAEGKPLFSPEVIDKLVYAESKITNYDKRIPELTSALGLRGISPAEAVENITNGQSVEKELAELESLLNNLQTETEQ